MAGKNHISSPLVLKGDIDPSIVPGAAAPIGCLFQHETDGRLWTKVGKADTAWSLFALITDVKPSLLIWGADDFGAAALTRYMAPGHRSGLAPTMNIFQFQARAGTAQKIRVRHNSPAGNGTALRYTLMVNGVASALTVDLATGAIGQTSFAANVVIADDSDLALQVSKPFGVIGAGVVDSQVVVEFA